MNNQSALKFFENMSINTKDNPNCVKLAHNTDYTHIDAEFILKYSDKNTEILDLGSGTGLIVNKIYDKVKSIDCVEQFKEFSNCIKKNSNIQIINENLFKYNSEKRYDLITMFGTMHYFNEEEAVKIYKKYYDYLKQNGKFIIKNQFGVNEDVIVNGYSEEQKTNYFAHYRYLGKEIDNLKRIGFKNIETFDIYPKEANRWDNTHFWAITASK